jgi:hypothetical protein
MGKHNRNYPPVERDLYPTPAWVTDTLARHLNLRGARVWEFACGRHDMVNALRRHGATVYATDIVDYGNGQDEVIDFLSDREPRLSNFTHLISNPPYGNRCKTAIAFIERGLERAAQYGATLALLLPAHFDSRASRRGLFVDRLSATVVLTERVVWFSRSDGVREQPMEDHQWFIWRPGRNDFPALHLYDEGSR